MSFQLLDETHAQAIETAADKLWLHEAEAFQDLPPVEASLLHVRIWTAQKWIEEFLPSEASPFDYPDGAFQEVLHWLLVDWWGAHGAHRASVHYFLYA